MSVSSRRASSRILTEVRFPAVLSVFTSMSNGFLGSNSPSGKRFSHSVKRGVLAGPDSFDTGSEISSSAFPGMHISLQLTHDTTAFSGTFSPSASPSGTMTFE